MIECAEQHFCKAYNTAERSDERVFIGAWEPQIMKLLR